MIQHCNSISLGSKGLLDGGLYIMRHDSFYMIVDCAPAEPKAPSGHKHNSRLGFELFAYDKSFIIDPGAYIYTANKEMRNLFRSTKYHNTVVVDGEEQNRFDENELFSMGREAAVKVNKWESTEEHDFLDAEHYGYKRLKNPVIHRRQISFNKVEGYWVIDDGRLHTFANYGNWNRLDHRYLLSIGAVLFKREDFKHVAGVFHEEAFWLLGEEGGKVFDAL